MGKILHIPGKGKLMVVTDIHGNMDDFRRYLDLFHSLRTDKSIVFTGDLIHRVPIGGGDDLSIEVLETAMELNKRHDIHFLLGDHEWSHITGIDVYKGGVNQSKKFREKLKVRFEAGWMDKLEEYTRFFRSLPIAVKIENGVFISHAGPPKDIVELKEIENPSDSVVSDLMWSRPGDYTEKDVNRFLEIVGCKAMVVGHTQVNGYKIFGSQLIMSSSVSEGKKAYLIIDLERKITDVNDLQAVIEFLN